MGLLDESGLGALIEAGCTGCAARKLAFRTYVDGTIPFMGGEPVGRVTWVYDGEKFVDGVYEVACAACGLVVFSADVCPRCHAPGGLQRALEAPNGYRAPAQCPSCDADEVGLVAFLPAVVTYVLRRFRTVTAEAGIPEATPIHITETGWPTDDDQRTESAQAEVLAAVADAVIASDAGIQTCEWFGLRDGLTTAAWSARFGILRDDYTPKARLHRPPAPHRHGIDAVSGPRLFSRNREGKMAAVPAERRDVPARRPS